jgi:hypothetical protein
MEPQAQESPIQESTVQEQAVRGTAIEEHADNGPQPPTDKPMAKTRTTRLHRKAILLPEITQLALEGQSGRAIAEKFDLPTRAVNHWLREVRSQWLTAATQRGADSMAVGLARLNGIYCEAMEAWRRAQEEIQAPAKTKSQAAGGERAATKKALRHRKPSDALLGRAISAVRESLKFFEGSAVAAAARVPACASAQPEPSRRPAEGLERMTNDELMALAASLKAQRELARYDQNCPNKPAQDELAPAKAC